MSVHFSIKVKFFLHYQLSGSCHGREINYCLFLCQIQTPNKKYLIFELSNTIFGKGGWNKEKLPRVGLKPLRTQPKTCVIFHL